MCTDDNLKTEHIGYLIKGIRESREIKQETLCRGVCSRSMLVRIEQGECIPDKMLLDALFQRLGLSIHKFETSYTANEYECMKLRQQIINSILEQDFIYAKQMILEYEKLYSKGSIKVLSQQFIVLIEILIEIGTKNNEIEIENKVYYALSLTCLNFQEKKISSYLFHDEELNLILLLAENLYKKRDTERAINIYFSLLGYIDSHVSDIEEQGRLYPKITVLLSEKLYKEHRYDELNICKKAIELLKKTYRINFLPELLYIRLAGWEREGNTKEHFKNRDSFLGVIYGLKELTASEVNRMELLFLSSDPIAPGHIMGEQIRSFRSILGITQENLGDICDPATVSRIEGGRKPHSRHYKKIMQRMGREGVSYHPFIKSNKYELHIATANLSNYISVQDYENAHKEIALLEEELDRTEPVNRQFLLKSRAILEEEEGDISQEILVERLVETLCITAPVKVEIEGEEERLRKKLSEEDLISLLKNWPLTQNEVSIWNNIAIMEGRRGDRAKKIQILSTIKKNYERSNVNILHNAQGYLLVTYNLANALQTKEATEEVLHICEHGIKISLAIGAGHYLVGFLNVKAWCMGKLRMKEEACLKVFKQAFSIADILNYKVMVNHIMKHCKNKFQVNIRSYSYSDLML